MLKLFPGYDLTLAWWCVLSLCVWSCLPWCQAGRSSLRGWVIPRRYLVFPSVSTKLENAVTCTRLLEVFVPCSVKAHSCPHQEPLANLPTAIFWHVGQGEGEIRNGGSWKSELMFYICQSLCYSHRSQAKWSRRAVIDVSKALWSTTSILASECT